MTTTNGQSEKRMQNGHERFTVNDLLSKPRIGINGEASEFDMTEETIDRMVAEALGAQFPPGAVAEAAERFVVRVSRNGALIQRAIERHMERQLHDAVREAVYRAVSLRLAALRNE